MGLTLCLSCSLPQFLMTPLRGVSTAQQELANSTIFLGVIFPIFQMPESSLLPRVPWVFYQVTTSEIFT